MHAAYVTCLHYRSTYARNLRQQLFFFAAKSEKNFQDVIMLVILPSFDLHLLKVALIFLSKILLSRCVDCFIKGIKELACSLCIVELSEHSRSARSSSLVLSKILPSLYDSTMQSARYVIPSVYVKKHPVQWRIELQGHLRSFFNPYLSPQLMANWTWVVRGHFMWLIWNPVGFN